MKLNPRRRNRRPRREMPRRWSLLAGELLAFDHRAAAGGTDCWGGCSRSSARSAGRRARWWKPRPCAAGPAPCLRLKPSKLGSPAAAASGVGVGGDDRLAAAASGTAPATSTSLGSDDGVDLVDLAAGVGRSAPRCAAACGYWTQQVHRQSRQPQRLAELVDGGAGMASSAAVACCGARPSPMAVRVAGREVGVAIAEGDRGRSACTFAATTVEARVRCAAVVYLLVSGLDQCGRSPSGRGSRRCLEDRHTRHSTNSRRPGPRRAADAAAQLHRPPVSPSPLYIGLHHGGLHPALPPSPAGRPVHEPAAATVTTMRPKLGRGSAAIRDRWPR